MTTDEPMTREQRAQIEAIVRELVPGPNAVLSEEETTAVLATVVVGAARGDADAMQWLATRRGLVPATVERVVQAVRALAWLH
jgi:hypothetical protein